MTEAGAQPPVSYVMPVLNEVKYIAAAVASVLAQDYDGDSEIVLALGPSTDGTDAVVAAMQRREPRLRTIANSDGTIPAGLNLAIRSARHPVIVRVDAHSELADGYTRRGVATLHRRQVDVVGGVMAARGRTPTQSAIAWAYGSPVGIGAPKYHVGGEEGPAESAYLGIYRRDRLLAVDGYDPAVLRGEDWDLCRRITSAGGTVWFDPELSVTYWPRSSLTRLAQQFFATGTWRGHLTRRDPAQASLRYFVPPVALAALGGGLILGLVGVSLGWLPLLAYGALLLAATAAARGVTASARLRLPAVLPIMHLSWGAGFWRGLLFGAAGTHDRGRR